MSKKNSLIFLFVALALGAIIVGFCFVFLGNDKIESAPNSLEVQEIDGEYYLVAEYNNNYGYQFQLEQMIDNNWTLVDTVVSDTNSIKLSTQNFNIIAGRDYRFAVCFATENGAGNGPYSSSILWKPSWTLATVDYSSLVFDEDKLELSWNKVNMADSYTIKFVDSNGSVSTKDSTENTLSLENVAVGRYTVYVVANSSNQYIFSSLVGEGKKISLIKENQILSVERTNSNGLKVTCSQKVESFDIYVDGVLKGNVEAGEGVFNDNFYSYSLSNAGVILKNVDFDSAVVQIKSVASKYVLESNMAEIV